MFPSLRGTISGGGPAPPAEVILDLMSANREAWDPGAAPGAHSSAEVGGRAPAPVSPSFGDPGLGVSGRLIEKIAPSAQEWQSVLHLIDDPSRRLRRHYEALEPRLFPLAPSELERTSASKLVAALLEVDAPTAASLLLDAEIEPELSLADMSKAQRTRLAQLLAESHSV